MCSPLPRRRNRPRHDLDAAFREQSPLGRHQRRSRGWRAWCQIWAVVTAGLALAVVLVGARQPPRTSATPAQALGRVVDVDGAALDVVARAPHAYLGLGAYVVVLDTSDPEAPVEVARSKRLPDAVTALELDDDRLLAQVNRRSGHPRGLFVFDVARPPTIAVVAETTLDGDLSAAADGYAYTTGRGARQAPSIVDIRDPRSPRLVGPLGRDNAADVVVRGRYAYVTGQDLLLAIYDVSDPEDPRWLSSVARPGAFGEAVAVGSRFALVDDGGFTHVVDISDPLRPQSSSSIQLHLVTVDMWVGDERALVAQPSYASGYSLRERSGRLVDLDLSDPRRPVARATLVLEDDPGGLAVLGETALVAGGAAGLLTVRLGDSGPATPTPVVAGMRAEGVVVMAGHAFVAGGREVVGLDLADPARPTRVARTVLGDASVLFSVAGTAGYLYATTHGSIRILDARDPSTMREIGRIGDEGTAKLAVAGHRLLAASYGLSVYSLQDPSHPTKESWVDAGAVTAVTADGDQAYVLDVGSDFTEQDVLRVIDLGGKEPTLRGSVAIPGKPHIGGFDGALVARGGTVFVDGTLVVDARDADHPRRMAEMLPPAYNAGGSALVGDWLVTASAGCLWITDISRPEEPVDVGSVRLAGSGAITGQAVAINGSDVLVAESDAGLSMFRTAPGGAPTTDAGCPLRTARPAASRLYLPAALRPPLAISESP